MNSSYFLSNASTPFWALLSTLVSTLGAWRLSISWTNAYIERACIKTNVEVSMAAYAEQAAYRAAMAREVDAVRHLSDGCGRNLAKFR